MKNILFLNTGIIWGGVEGWHYKTAKELLKRGYNVKILAVKNTPFHKRCQSAGLDVDFIKKINSGAFLNPIKIFKLSRYLKKEKIDVMFFCQSSHFKIGSVAGYLAGVERIIYRRALAKPINNHFYNRIFLNKCITDFMAISKTTLEKSFEKLPKNVISNSKIKLIYNGVKKSDFLESKADLNLRKEFNIKDDEVLIANIGRLGNQKAQQDLLYAVGVLKNEFTKFKVLIVGKGNRINEYKDIVNKLNLSDKVIFTGFRKDIPSILKQIDFVVHTALYEGCPWIVLETMAAGKPIVAVEIPSIEELVIDGETGYLSPRNRNELSDNIFRMIKSENKKEMGKKAKNIFENNYTFELMINKIEDYFLS